MILIKNAHPIATDEHFSKKTITLVAIGNAKSMPMKKLLITNFTQ